MITQYEKKLTFLVFFGVLLFFSLEICGEKNNFFRSHTRKEYSDWLSQPRLAGSYRRPFSPQTPEKFRLTHFFGELAQDVFWINAGLFSWDTFKIFVGTMPFYAITRMTDEKMQNCFFDHANKKNKNEPVQWCKELARFSIAIPITLLGLQSLISSDQDLRQTGQVFWMGMPFVLFIKDIIKTLDFDVCKRPWHEAFAKEQRKHGGFPSGHLAEVSYMAVLYGMRYGQRFAIPLGAVGLFVTSVFLSCNRHYLSQMLAGASFGAMYALSANKLIDSKLAKKRDISVGMSFDSGSPKISFTYNF